MNVNEKNFLYVLNSIRQRMFKFLKKGLAQKQIDGIAPSYGDILFVLDRKGPLSLQELAKYTIKDKSTISLVVQRLESEGYITKEKQEDDARYVRLALTPKARSLRPALLSISSEMNAKMFQGLTEDEKSLLFNLIGKVYKNI